MVFSLIWSIFAWTNVDHISGTDCNLFHHCLRLLHLGKPTVGYCQPREGVQVAVEAPGGKAHPAIGTLGYWVRPLLTVLL